ncbi:MAG: MFS transporter [Verrucomicrobiota bacterium JB022]|nr:MFS transporter [Verrucomicrobiota bacterium JB022]
MRALPKSAWAWALYDWANSAFALSILVIFYGPFFTSYWYDGPKEQGLWWVALSVTVSSIAVAILAPLLGAVIEGGRLKKKCLLGTATLGIVATAGLAAVPAGAWEWALGMRLLASLGFFGSLVCYDALLTEVSTRENRHFVSGLGFSLGYLGSVMLLIAQFVLVQKPELLGLDAAGAVKVSYITVALWWLVFTLPLILWVPERAASEHRDGIRAAIGHTWRELRSTVGFLRATPTTAIFLLAYFFYTDGANTLTNMTATYAEGAGIASQDLMMAIILVQFVGVPCAVLLGFLGQKMPPRLLITGCILVYLGVTLYSFRLSPVPVDLFGFQVGSVYILAVLIGIVQGGLQALSRSYLANVVPETHIGGCFGFYNMLGKGGAIMGPLLMGGFATLSGEQRWGALAVGILFIIGLVLLWRAPRPVAAA